MQRKSFGKILMNNNFESPPDKELMFFCFKWARMIRNKIHLNYIDASRDRWTATTARLHSPQHLNNGGGGAEGKQRPQGATRSATAPKRWGRHTCGSWFLLEWLSSFSRKTKSLRVGEGGGMQKIKEGGRERKTNNLIFNSMKPWSPLWWVVGNASLFDDTLFRNSEVERCTKEGRNHNQDICTSDFLISERERTVYEGLRLRIWYPSYPPLFKSLSEIENCARWLHMNRLRRSQGMLLSRIQ